MAITIGSEIFSTLPGSVTKIALALATTLPNVSRWASGERTPGLEMRRKIFELYGKPAPDEWLQPVTAPEYSDPPALEFEVELERATPQAVEGEADELLRMLRQARLEAALKTDVGERLQLIAQSAQAMLALGKISGAGLNLTEAKILASPQWRNIETMITLSLEPWPEAMRAVAETLKRLAGITGPT